MNDMLTIAETRLAMCFEFLDDDTIDLILAIESRVLREKARSQGMHHHNNHRVSRHALSRLFGLHYFRQTLRAFWRDRHNHNSSTSTGTNTTATATATRSANASTSDEGRSSPRKRSRSEVDDDNTNINNQNQNQNHDNNPFNTPSNTSTNTNNNKNIQSHPYAWKRFKYDPPTMLSKNQPNNKTPKRKLPLPKRTINKNKTQIEQEKKMREFRKRQPPPRFKCPTNNIPNSPAEANEIARAHVSNYLNRLYNNRLVRLADFAVRACDCVPVDDSARRVLDAAGIAVKAHLGDDISSHGLNEGDDSDDDGDDEEY